MRVCGGGGSYPASTVFLDEWLATTFFAWLEELYFRGYLLPRISRYGRWAPVVNTALFSLYHLWTPWQNVARIVGFLPIAWSAWHFRSIQASILAHVTINVLFLLGLLALVLQGS